MKTEAFMENNEEALRTWRRLENNLSREKIINYYQKLAKSQKMKLRWVKINKERIEGFDLLKPSYKLQNG